MPLPIEGPSGAAHFLASLEPSLHARSQDDVMYGQAKLPQIRDKSEIIGGKSEIIEDLSLIYL